MKLLPIYTKTENFRRKNVSNKIFHFGGKTFGPIFLDRKNFWKTLWGGGGFQVITLIIYKITLNYTIRRCENTILCSVKWVKTTVTHRNYY